MRSRSPKSNHFFPPSQCVCASFVKIHTLVQCRQEATQTPTPTNLTLKSAGVTLKMITSFPSPNNVSFGQNPPKKGTKKGEISSVYQGLFRINILYEIYKGRNLKKTTKKKTNVSLCLLRNILLFLLFPPHMRAAYIFVPVFFEYLRIRNFPVFFISSHCF